MSDLTGTTLGPYTIVEKIGGGGMATVYKAYQASMDRYVALKVVRADMSHDPQFRERFDREARTIARLEHRYILPVHDFGEANGIPYLVMRYTSGGTLDALIAAGSLSQARAIKFVAQIAEALDYAHTQNVIHRDIKPANVLLSADDTVLLTDFGIAKLMAGTTALTGTGMMVGTPFYMAPEQVRSQPIDGRTDIYALGIMLYECLTGQRPFTGDTPLAVMYMQVRDPLPLPHAINAAIGADLERIIFKATAKEPADRYQTAGELAAALNTFSTGVHYVGDRTPAPAAAPAPSATAVLPATVALADPALRPIAGVADSAPQTAPRRAGSRWAWGGGLLALVAGLLAGWSLLGQRADVAPNPAVVVTAAAPTLQPTSAAASPAAVLFSYSFADGSAAGWTGDPAEWRVVSAEQDQFAYEGLAPSDAFTSAAPPASDGAAIAALANYAVELRLRIAEAGDANDDLADIWFALRAVSDQSAHNGCESYSFFLDSTSDSVMLARNGSELCGGFTVLSETGYPLEPSRWYALRLIVNGTRISLSIDGALVAEADDPTIAQGFMYVSLGPGATVQLAQIEIQALP